MDTPLTPLKKGIHYGMIETKKEGDIDLSDTQEKSLAALQYCKHATEFTTHNSGKPWKYVLIPHNAVQANMSFEYLVRNFEYKHH